MSSKELVPFNDLSRIHLPLADDFIHKLNEALMESTFVLGEEVSRFEKELAFIEGCKYAVGVNSGTTAIELALRSLGVGIGDEVITTAFTFVATCFSIMQTGATPVLVDIDPLTGLLDPSLIEEKITSQTKAIVFVTLHGRVENIEQIKHICDKNDLKFIIDAAQSHLGMFKDQPQTSFCDAATLSFYPGKNLGALGEGGAILTNSQELREKCLLMRDWGSSEKYLHVTWGGNFRLESLQASFLRIKLNKLREWTKERQEIAGVYLSELHPNLLMKSISRQGSHVYHIFSIHVENRIEVCQKLSQAGVGYGLHYPRAIHQQPAFKDFVECTGSLAHSEWLASSTLSLPLFPKQTEKEIKKVVDLVNSLTQGQRRV